MFLVESCCRKAGEQISSSFIRSSKHARDLARVTARLKDRRAYFVESVRAGELTGEAVTQEASDWLKRGAMVEETARTLLEDHGNKFTCLCDRYTRRRRAVDDVIALAKELCDTASDIRITKPEIPPAVVEIPMETSIRGMDRYISRILCDDSEGIVGVWGAPGVGKTTLLRCINNSFLHDVRFDYVIWAVASTVERLQENIADRLKLRQPETSPALAIFETLKDKKFLLLLDDVWEAVDLAAAGVPRPSRAQKVVFATRSEYLCRAMKANLSIKLEGLAPEDAWSLFEEKLGRLDGDVADVPVIRKLAEEIVEGCQGLPLALVTVGRAMARRGSSLASWKRASELLQQRPSAIPGMEEHFFPIIKLRYDMLPLDTVRNCFLYCSLWPAGCSIGREELIESWMGLGLMNETTTADINEAYDFGHSVIEALKSEGMLEPAGCGGVEMTSVMRGFAHWVASGCGEDHTRWLLRSGPMEDLKEWKSAEHISLTHSNTQQILPSLQAPFVCLNLTTLVLRGNRALNSIPNCFFEAMPGLRYLDLSGTGIDELPKEIGVLTELIFLNLSHTYITSLPKEMEKLAKLKFLRLQGTMYLTTVPRGLLSSLRSLQVLDLTGSGYQFHLKDSRHEGGEDIKLLGSLRKGVRAIGITVTSVPALRWLSAQSRVPIRQLWIISLDCLAGPTLKLLSPELLGSSNIRESLRDLAIKHSKDLEVVDAGTGSLPRLETLHLVQLTAFKEISWYGTLVPEVSLPYLRELHISFCPKLKHVTWVLRLPCLEHLSLRGCTQMEDVISAKSQDENDGPTEFPSLKELVMEDLPAMESIYRSTRAAAAFPLLESFSVSGCPRLTRPPFDWGKLQRIKCEKGWWEKLHVEEIRSSLAPCVVYIPVAAPPPPPPPPPPVPPRSLVLLRKGMNTAVSFLGALVFRAFFVSLVFVLIKASPPDFLFFFSFAVSLAGWLATRWRWMKRKITRLGFPI